MSKNAEQIDQAEDTGPTAQEIEDQLMLAAREAFDEAVEVEGADENSIKLAIAGAGILFNKAGNVYKKFMIDAGLSISKEDKSEIVAEVMAESEALDTEDGFYASVGAIVERANGVSTKSAAASVRAWAKAQDEEIVCFVKPKGSTGATREGFRTRFYDALVANPAMTKDECHQYLLDDVDSSDNKMKHESNFQGMRGLANRIWEMKAA